MNHKTIYLLQGDYQHSLKTLGELKNILQPQDSVVLLGEAILAYMDCSPHFQQMVYILAEEQYHLNLNTQLISFDDLADLIINHQRCVRLM